jgi:hypothetical protein
MNTDTSTHSKLYIDRKKVAIDYSDIVYLEGDENYTIIYLSNGKKVLCARTLKDITNHIQSVNSAVFTAHIASISTISVIINALTKKLK